MEPQWFINVFLPKMLKNIAWLHLDEVMGSQTKYNV